MKAFGRGEQHWRKRVPGARSWVWYYWALENDATVFGRSLERKGKGYIAQEADRILRLMRHGTD